MAQEYSAPDIESKEDSSRCTRAAIPSAWREGATIEEETLDGKSPRWSGDRRDHQTGSGGGGSRPQSTGHKAGAGGGAGGPRACIGNLRSQQGADLRGARLIQRDGHTG